MTNLMCLVKAIEKIADALPNVNKVITSDIYQLNSLPDIDYSVFCITQDQHRADQDYYHYNFVLYYVDRLLVDKSNQLEIQSHGIEVLSTVINKIEDLGVIINTEFNERTYQVFTQRFSDECAGVYARVEVRVPIDCATRWDFLVNPLLADLATWQPGTYYPEQFGADAFRVVTVSGQSYHFYTEGFDSAKIDNGRHSLEVNNNGVLVDGQKVTTNDVLSAYTYNKANTVNVCQYEIEQALSPVRQKVSANTENIQALSAMTVDFVLKNPTWAIGTSAQSVDFNTLTTTGYYRVNPNNSYAVNGPWTGGWQGDGNLHVYTASNGHIVQDFTITIINNEQSWPRKWWRVYGWDMEQSQMRWSDWTEYLVPFEVVLTEPVLLQGNSATTIDFNDYTHTGYYYVAFSYTYCVNSPTPNYTEDGYLNVVHKRQSTTMQEYTTINLDNPKKYFRVYGYDAEQDTFRWGAWREITTTPVTQ